MLPHHLHLPASAWAHGLFLSYCCGWTVNPAPIKSQLPVLYTLPPPSRIWRQQFSSFFTSTLIFSTLLTHLHQCEIHCNISPSWKKSNQNGLSWAHIPTNCPLLCSPSQQNFTKVLSLFVNSGFSYFHSFLNPTTSLKLLLLLPTKTCIC